MKSELDLFSLPLTQTSIESSAFLYYKPISSLSDENDSPLEFLVPSSTEHYLDLAHTMLHLSVQILPESTEIERNKVAPVNNFIHSLFDQIDIFFNQKLVSSRS